jgi:hypothetical protein
LGAALAYSLQEEVGKIVTQYISEHVMPDVVARLEADHDTMVTAIVEAVGASVTLYRDRLIEQMTKKIAANDWTIRKITKELFESAF